MGHDPIVVSFAIILSICKHLNYALDQSFRENNLLHMALS